MLKIQDVFGVELRMNRSTQDEYEEVESPFAAKSSDKSRLRSRKNVFNRPFAADSTVAPAIFETSSRKSIGHPDHIDLAHHRQSDLSQTEIDYLDDEYLEEDEVETKKSVVRTPSSAKKKEKNKKNLLNRIGWAVIAVLTLRLIFMDRGVWDYFAAENTIQDKTQELRSIESENKDLRTEIQRIRLDQNYQKQLAKEHLGVISVDEFLILFAGESIDTASDSAAPNQL